MQSLTEGRVPDVVSARRAGRGPTIGIVALSAIADDPRVRRQGDAFFRAGWNVIGIGLPGARSAAPEWLAADDSHEDAAAPGQDVAGSAVAETRSGAAARGSGAGLGRLKTVARAAGLTPALRWGFRRAGQVHRLTNYVLRMQAPRLSPRFAERAYWPLNSRFQALYASAARHDADIWLANDWTALPIGRRLARAQGAGLVYDTHELASDEYADRLRWRVLHRPVVVGLERECLKDAALVTCVSDGIADRLRELYGLAERPTVIRNTPAYQELPLRPTGERIEVLYHGVVSPGRGLEECIRSVALWRPEFSLTIRGPVAAAYRAQLEQEIATAGVSGRVHLAPPVPMVDLVREAARFDVGIFALPGHSLHNRYALPNKFFEYAMAGLALCVSDLPEMGRLLRARDLGVLMHGMAPEAIAGAINSLDRESIDRYKAHALDAAREFNWEQESNKLIDRCSAILASRTKT